MRLTTKTFSTLKHRLNTIMTGKKFTVLFSYWHDPAHIVRFEPALFQVAAISEIKMENHCLCVVGETGTGQYAWVLGTEVDIAPTGEVTFTLISSGLDHLSQKCIFTPVD